MEVGIRGWGAYIPRFRLSAQEIAALWGYDSRLPKALGIVEKSVAEEDEDSVTMGWYAARVAMRRAGVGGDDIDAVFFGTESKPYAVKPSATIIADALGVKKRKLASDLEFACRAAGEGVRISVGLVKSGLARNALVIGSDTAQANPGDLLDFTASSGAVAFVIGSGSSSAAAIEASVTYVTDTPDFWRRDRSPYPEHAEIFTGEPAYFHHIVSAVRLLLEETGLKVGDFDYAIFHQPNGRFPLQVARSLGIPQEKVAPGLVTPYIGNTYNASALLGLAKVLEEARPGSRILVATFGSGAGSDAFSIVVRDSVLELVKKGPRVVDMVNFKVQVTYGEYSKFRGLLLRNVGG
ncbi:MAG: hydroxymethylglutaryl-CoA synthase [Sulfolobales archaeon]|nr:hydroxymethylglutaryl-CoA synthase [Sulfolobales archaeon]